MTNKKEFWIFNISLILALIYWRLRILLFYKNNELPYLRAITGLKIHHYHYGIILILIALLFFIFFKKHNFFIVLAGFGLGSILDGLISGMLQSSSRAQELANYNENLDFTIFLFIAVILFSFIFYKISKTQRYKYLN